MRRLSFIVLWAMVLLAVAHQAYKWWDNKSYSKEEIESRFEPVTSEYGIRVVYEIGEDFFSPIENPPIPAGPPKNSAVKPIHHQVLLRYPSILQKAFSKYPVEIIKNYLSAIYFAGEINSDGFMAGGAYDPFRRIIYLVDSGMNNDDEAMSTFHHEFSSLFIRRHSFFVNPWTDHHPKGFKYLGEKYDHWEEVKKARETFTDSDCYEKGIVSNYGLTNFGNDFSEYSAMIFTYPQKFKEIMDKYPRVRGKFLVWLEFYQKIDPIFTEAYLFGEGSLN